MKIKVKKERIGSTRLIILSPVDVPVNKVNKKIIEEQLRQYAFDHLLDKRSGHIYNHWENDTASIIIIEDVNVLTGELLDI